MLIPSWLRNLQRNETRKRARQWKKCPPGLLRLEDRIAPAAGLLDLSFGGNGSVTTDFLQSFDFVNTQYGAAVAPNGDIVVAGTSDQNGASDFAVARYNPDGSLDNSFGMQGKVTIDLGSAEDFGQAIVIQPDGNLLVSGFSRRDGQNVDFAVIRLTSTGELDASFGTGGVAFVDFSSRDTAWGMAMQADGKIVVAGDTSPTESRYMAVTRLMPDGQLDATFGAGGKQTVAIGSNSSATGIAIQPDGFIVLAGFVENGNDFGAARMTPIGQLDLAFGIGGHQTIDFGSQSDNCWGLALTGDGRIILSGFSIQPVTGRDFAVAALTAEGELDGSFGISGKQTIDFGSEQDTCYAMAVQPNGGLILGGYTYQTATEYDFATAWVSSTGQLDSSIGAAGRVTTDLGSVDEWIGTLLVQPDGNVIAVGTSWQTSTAYDFALARYFGGSQVLPSTLQGMVWVDFNNDGEVNFGELAIEGVTISLTGFDDLGQPVNLSTTTDINGIYSFTDLRPSNAAGYSIIQSQPAGYLDGLDTLGTIDSAIVGSDVVNDAFSGIVLPPGSLAENYNFGERPANGGNVGSGQTATIGFWQNKNGQNLIKALNGGATATQLGSWLAATFPNMYGALAGLDNSQVAAHYKTLFGRNGQSSPGGPPKVDAQIMATALAVYVTNQTLAGTTAAAYGFQVTQYGVGAASFNVGNNGAAYGVADGTFVSVMDLLLAVNARSSNGLLFDQNGDGMISPEEAGMRTMANNVFSLINESGGV
jgi:uncharacterized delta-60 repeat protein